MALAIALRLNSEDAILSASRRLGAWVDSLLVSWSARPLRADGMCALAARYVTTPVGPVWVDDSGVLPGPPRPCVVFVPDGPNVMEHYANLIALLAPHVRVVCFDMPGFGRSFPDAAYLHSADQGAQAVLGVMDALEIDAATLAFSCVNGFYAYRTAQLAGARITRLVLSQTPSLEDMHRWTQRIIPWPIKTPIVGQVLGWLARKKIALRWYPIALPRHTNPRAFQKTTRRAMACGGCFCLAGVVQGMLAENASAFEGINTPCTLVWGGMDRSHKPTPLGSFRAHLPDAEIVVFDDCGHFPEIEQPERFAALLLSNLGAEHLAPWINRLAARSTSRSTNSSQPSAAAAQRKL
jgi:pimeloyl-ACP methyl ester carboxylesterase